MVFELYRFNVWLCLYLVGDKRKMTKEQIKQKAEEWMRNNSERCTKENMNGYDFAIATCIAVTTEATKELEKENAELEKEISVLLSCKNCPENKGGYICEKEYNDKCLTQKIQYIKELKEENAELKEEVNKIAFARGSLEEENAELKRDNSEWEKASDKWKSVYEITNNQLTNAKDILRMIVYWKSDKKELLNFINKAEQFISEVEK
jgi:hypothetical protein